MPLCTNHLRSKILTWNMDKSTTTKQNSNDISSHRTAPTFLLGLMPNYRAHTAHIRTLNDSSDVTRFMGLDSSLWSLHMESDRMFMVAYGLIHRFPENQPDLFTPTGSVEMDLQKWKRVETGSTSVHTFPNTSRKRKQTTT